MSKPNLNRPAIHASRPLDATDFACSEDESTDFANLDTDEAEGLPMPTRGGQIVGGVLVLLSALLVIVAGWHLIALVLP